VALVRTKPAPAKEERKNLGALVDVKRVESERRHLDAPEPVASPGE
jgi:hypothetical protein